jgi:hypothetical protein
MRTIVAWVVVGLLLAGGAGMAVADGVKPATRMSRDLANLGVPPTAAAAAAGALDAFSELPPPVPGDWVTIDAVAAGDPSALEAELLVLGARDTAIAGRLVSARLPIAAIPSLEGVASLQFARRAHHRTNVGTVTSQGDHVLRADTARATFGLDGSGVMVGVLSDSFNCIGDAAGDIATGDLSAVTVLQEEPGCASGTDEGRAMLQIVHDVAPGASLAFATAFTGQAGFANNIRALRDAGATVIVDDVIHIDEPMFQDGVVAQAVDEVKASGVAYFSAAGNNARRAYEHAFVPGQFLAPGTFGGGFFGGTAHNFGGTVMQRVAAPGGGTFSLALQWDSPFFSVSGAPGTRNDLDVYLISGGQVVTAGTTDNLLARDPVESLGVVCSAPFGSQCVGFIVIVNHSGANPGRFKYVVFSAGGNPTLSPATNSGTIYGHANANGAVAVGAVNYKTPTTLETFSSGGTTPVLFDTSGDLLVPADPRQFKPEIVAPDGTDTTFFGFDTDGTGFPNFFGTSASAPHAAAVAALLLEAVPTLTPDEVRTTLENTAQNLGPAGFDINTGFGLIHADSALDALHVLAITAGPSGTPNPVVPGGAVSLSASATDSFGHTLTFAWTSTCTGGLPAGGFNNAALATPTWTAPRNATGTSQTCALKVTVSDGHGLSKSATHTETVLPVARITSLTPAMGPVGTSVTIAGMSLTGATTVTFAGPVTVTPTAVTATSLHAVVPPGARTGVLSVTTPIGTGPSLVIFKVLPRITGFAAGSAVGGSATVIVVSGTNLRAATGEPVVKIGAFVVPPVSIVSSTPTELRFRVPVGAVTGKISVTTVDGTTLSATNLTVIQPPRATAFAPAAAVVGTAVTITGTNLAGATGVTFAGGVAVAPTPVTATSLRAVVPAGALTGPVSITNGIGTAASTAIFKVLPRITGFAPVSAVGGSTRVIVVRGTNLRAATGQPAVKISAFVVPPGSVVSSTPTEVQFRVPLGAVTGKIGVTTVDGTTLSATDLTVVQPPRATAFAPAAAVVGTAVTITGTNLAGATGVTFASGVTVAPTLVTATSLRVVVPAGALTGPVRITNGIGTAASAAIFKVLPKIMSFAPTSAVGGSATVIVVSGTNLRAATGQPAVKIGAFVVPPGSIVSSTLTELRFRVPLGAVTGKISVTTVDGTTPSATDLTVIQPPRATAFAPAAAVVGTAVTITGTNLAGVTGVTFAGGVTVAPTPVTATSLRAVVPAGALTGPVSITNGIGTGVSTVVFRVAPRITDFAPASAVGGSTTVIAVTGTNLRAATGQPAVKIGAFVVPPGSIVSSTPTELRFRVPLGAVTGRIGVTTVDGTTPSATDLTVIQPPRATTIAPPTAVVGTTVTITGTNLAGATGVTFTGGMTVTPTAVTATSLRAVVPTGAVTGPVSITNGIGTGVSAVVFKVAPKITSLAPASAVGGSATVIVVSGTNLRAATGQPAVKIGAFVVPPGSIVSSTLTELRFRVPLGAVTGKISVTTMDGTTPSATDLTVIQPPRATAFAPAAAVVGTTVTITGTNLAGATGVTFAGGVTVTPTAVTATSLRAVVPAGALTGPVSITNGIGTAASAAIFKTLPKITGFTPSVAALGSMVVVSGTNLETGAAHPVVKVGTVAAVVVASSPTEVTFTVPALAITGTISITTADGTAVSAISLTVTP